MKFIKLICSRIVIISLSILIQIGLIIFFGYILEKDNIYVQIVLSALGVLIFYAIVSKEESTAFKLPWITIILLFPFAGLITYVMFGNVKMTRKTHKRMSKLFKESQEILIQDENVLRELQEDSFEAYGQSNYLNKTSFLPLYRNGICEYLSTGEMFFKELKKHLKEAKEYIFLEYFIISEGKMWNEILDILEFKISMGVKVYVMYDDIGSISSLPMNYCKKLKALGINAVKYNRYLPIISVTHNNRDHRKIAVIDGVKGFISGCNIGDEYINEKCRFGKWKDAGIYLQGKAVNNLVILFIQLYNSNNKSCINFKDYIREHTRVGRATSGYIQPFGDGPRPFYKNYIGESVYLNLIWQAKKYLYITTPYLIVDYHFIMAIKNAAKRGVDVRIITPHIPDKKAVYLMTKNNYSTLIEAGVKIYEYKDGFIHSKVFLTDDEYSVVGTINLDYRSLVHHYECGVWMYKTPCLEDIKIDFNDLFENKTIMITRDEAKLKWYQRIIRNIMAIFAPLM